MLDLSKLSTDVAAILGAEKSAAALLNALGTAIKAIPPSSDPTTQAALDALAGQLETGTADLSAAIAANPLPAVTDTTVSTDTTASDAATALADGTDHKDNAKAINPLTP